jgi:hypothetical protein
LMTKVPSSDSNGPMTQSPTRIELRLARSKVCRGKKTGTGANRVRRRPGPLAAGTDRAAIAP